MAFPRFYFQILTATVVSMHENKDANKLEWFNRETMENQAATQTTQRKVGYIIISFKTGERVVEMYTYIHYLMIVF